MLHYLTVRQAMASVYRPVLSKSRYLTSSTSRRMAFKAVLNAKVALYLALLKSPLCFLFEKKKKGAARMGKHGTCTVEYQCA